MASTGRDTDRYLVVVNEEGRLSCWPAGRAVPRPWRTVSAEGTKEQCLAHIRDFNRQPNAVEERPNIGLGLMFFGDRDTDPTGNKYRLLLECARFADQHDLAAIWLPERHFTRFGCLYPSPAVLHAALARETRRIRLRAGSVVLPLHPPVRVAEDWAVVDNLSGGRVELAFASGWHPNDFALAPDAYDVRYQRMYEGIRQVQLLWRGENLALRNGSGQTIDVRTYPAPLQRELPVWLTAAGNPQTFERAGELGYHVLSHLFHQRVEDLADNIALYRQARARCGWDPAAGQVAVALHTFVGASLDSVRRHARQPYCDYLRANLRLLGDLAFSRGRSVDIAALPPQEQDEILDWMFEKFLGGRSLLGTPDSCYQMAAELARIGVSEIACLLDFGPEPGSILANLPCLGQLQSRLGRAQ